MNDDITELKIGLAVEVATRGELEIRLIQRIDLEKESMAQALQIAAVDTERRLDYLNGEVSRLNDVKATHVTREAFESNKKWMLGLFWALVILIFAAIGGSIWR